MESIEFPEELVFEEEQRPVDTERAAKLKAAMLQFVVTMKNMALYPETNKTNIEAVHSLFQWLDEYLALNNTLILEVTKDQLLTDDGAVVYQEKPTDQILSGPLFRDGVQALSFEHGVTEKELRSFLDILLKFRNQDSDDEDLVATLWEASLTHIRYIISSEYEQVGQEYELTAMKVSKPGVSRDADAPFNKDSALDPMGTDGLAPVSKPIASLFALAESNSFFGSTANGYGQGAVSKAASASERTANSGADGQDGLAPGAEVAYSGIDFAGDESGPTDQGDLDSSGFNPLDGRHAGYDDSEKETRDTFSKLSGDKKEGRPSDSEGLAGGPPTDDSAPDAHVDENGQAEPFEDNELEIDLDSVTEAFNNLQARQPSENKSEEALNPLALELLKQRPAAEGVELEERLRYWGLSNSEINQISALIKVDDYRDFSYDTLEIVNVLLYSGLVDDSNVNLITVFLGNEIQTSLKKVDLKYLNNFYQGLKDRAAAGGHLESVIQRDLQRRIDSSDLLNVLVEPGPSEEAITVGFEDLRYFLYQLSSIGVQTLTTILPKIANQKLWALVIELVAYDLLNSGSGSTDVLSRLNDRALTYLIRLIQGNIKALPPQIINGLTRHKSPSVRETVARSLLEHDSDNFHHLCAHMVLDSDPSVLKVVRPALATRRNTSVEGYLFNFLRNSFSNDQHEDDNVIIECYKIYGRCASSSALPFLEEVLMKKSFKTFLSRTLEPHKLGAAMALLLMPENSGAGEVLYKASRSSFRNVRQAYNEAKSMLSL